MTAINRQPRWWHGAVAVTPTPAPAPAPTPAPAPIGPQAVAAPSSVWVLGSSAGVAEVKIDIEDAMEGLVVVVVAVVVVVVAAYRSAWRQARALLMTRVVQRGVAVFARATLLLPRHHTHTHTHTQTVGTQHDRVPARHRPLARTRVTAHRPLARTRVTAHRRRRRAAPKLRRASCACERVCLRGSGGCVWSGDSMWRMGRLLRCHRRRRRRRRRTRRWQRRPRAVRTPLAPPPTHPHCWLRGGDTSRRSSGCLLTSPTLSRRRRLLLAPAPTIQTVVRAPTLAQQQQQQQQTALLRHHEPRRCLFR